MANEKRLIDANAFMAYIGKQYCTPCKANGQDYHEIRCRACWVDDMILELDAIPTVDAVEALRAYAYATDNKTLSNDIYNLVGDGGTVRKWIPVTESLPGICEPVLVCCDFMGGKAFRVSDRYGKNGMLWTGVPQSQKVTHWMPLPEPAKE